jgi:hypothetical protein
MGSLFDGQGDKLLLILKKEYNKTTLHFSEY